MPKDMTARERAAQRACPKLLATEFPEVRAAPSCCPTARRCLIRCSSASSARTPRRCAPMPTRSRRSCAPTRTCAASTTTGTSRSRCLRLEVDQDKARALGVSSQAIAQAARTINGGTTIGQYRDGDKLIDIVLRQPLDERNAHHRSGQRLRAHRQRRSIPLGADRQGALRLGAAACSGAKAATTRPRCRATSSKACRARP